MVDADPEEFDLLHKVNTTGVLIMTGAVAAVMKSQDERYVEGRSGKRGIGRGSIINISSLIGSISQVNSVQYCASKAGVIMVTKTAAKELNGSGVRVNCVSPGWVKTPMYNRMSGRYDMANMALPMGRPAYAEEVAAVCHFLCSPDASYVHGVDFGVDGGVKC